MPVKEFTSNEWDKIIAALDKDPDKYGFPKRVSGSVLIGSFNIRKLGNPSNRSEKTWDFLKRVCRQFDLLAIQEVMDDLGGIRKLQHLLGEEYGLIISDKTGVFPGERGVGERLAFLFRWRNIRRTEVASDITYDRSKVLDTLVCHWEGFSDVMISYRKKLKEYDTGVRDEKPGYPKLPVFLTFIRAPFCVSFEAGEPVSPEEEKQGRGPYQFMIVNAHLLYGSRLADRQQEFDALMEWIIARVKEEDKAYYPNFLLLGDLNLDYDVPEKDRKRIEKHMKELNSSEKSGNEANVNFPFLDIHPGERWYFRTNARLNQTFDQIGLFNRDKRLPTYKENESMGQKLLGPDYGMFNFVRLFCDALGEEYITPAQLMKLGKKNPKRERFGKFVARFEYEVSDHMPIWLRLPLP
jgi:endonuclease/exonuclease/phosphatase family metal-dependent hydrolase